MKAVLQSYPVLQAPDFEKQFKLVIDTSDLGTGAVLQQEDSEGIDHSVAVTTPRSLMNTRKGILQ